MVVILTAHCAWPICRPGFFFSIPSFLWDFLGAVILGRNHLTMKGHLRLEIPGVRHGHT